MKKFSKQEAAAMLKVSVRTLCNYMKSGRVQFTKDEDTLKNGFMGNARVWFTYEGLGLVDPATLVKKAPSHNLREPATNLAARPLTELEKQEQAAAEFARAYLAGEVTDSSGNYVNGWNDRWPTKGIQSLLGPVEDHQGPPVDVQVHMNPALLGDTVQVAHSFDKGMSDENYQQAMRDWRSRSGGPSMSEQRARQQRSKAMIHRAFTHAHRSTR